MFTFPQKFIDYTILSCCSFDKGGRIIILYTSMDATSKLIMTIFPINVKLWWNQATSTVSILSMPLLKLLKLLQFCCSQLLSVIPSISMLPSDHLIFFVVYNFAFVFLSDPIL